jgi:methyl-accepting chemotaxis protein
VNPLGHAKNEAFELIFGNILIAVGGIILGFLYNDPITRIWSLTSIILFGFGIIFDVRVLSRFSYELGIVKNEIKSAKQQTSEMLEKMEEQGNALSHATEKVNEASREIEEQQKKLEEVSKKTFSRIGSHAGSFTSVEDMVNKTFEALDERLKKLENRLGMSGSFWRSRKPY